MEYIPVILAFASGISAIYIGGRWDTWDKKQIGIKKLTIPGWIALIFVISSLIYSLASTYRQREEKQIEEIERIKLGKIVAVEISRSLESLLSPFRALYTENKSGNYESEITIDMMLDDGMLKAAQDTCLELRPKTFLSFPDSGTWSDIFHRDITLGITRIDRLVNRYGMKMNADILDALQDIQVNGYFSGYVGRRVVRNSDTEKSWSVLPPCVIGQAIGSHKQYLTMLKRIESLNQAEALIH